MTSAEYQRQAHMFASYGKNRTYPYAGLAEEAGEVLGNYAKFILHNDGIDPHSEAAAELPYEVRAEYREAIRKELGDVLWMVAEVATVNSLNLGDIMVGNIEKLADRKRRGVINGSGDNR